MFTHKEIVAQLDITHRQLLYFTDKGIIVPAQKAIGRGSTHVYSEDSIAETRLAILLRDAGFTFERIKDILDVYRTLAAEIKPGHRLIIDGDQAYLSDFGSDSFDSKVGISINLIGLGAPLPTPGNGAQS